MAEKYQPLDDIAGASREFEVGGKTLTCSPLRVKDLGEAEAKIKSKRRRAFDLYLESFPPEYRPSREEINKERQSIWNAFVSDMEIGQWLFNTWEGMIWMLWKAVSKNHDISLEELEKLVNQDEEIRQVAKELGELSGFEIDDIETEGEESSDPPKQEDEN